MCESNKLYYIDLSVDYEYPGSYTSKMQFLKNIDLLTEDNTEYVGDIIYCNPMIEHMLQYLFMNDDELTLYTGFTTPDRYKLQIINSLKLFWD